MFSCPLVCLSAVCLVPSLALLVCLLFCLLVCWSAFMSSSVCLPVCLFVCFSVCIICLSVCLSVCVCLSIVCLLACFLLLVCLELSMFVLLSCQLARSPLARVSGVWWSIRLSGCRRGRHRRHRHVESPLSSSCLLSPILWPFSPSLALECVTRVTHGLLFRLA